MIAGHRWERDYSLRGYECVGLSIGGVESKQWCIGCGCFIGDIELKRAGFPREEKFYLDILALHKGFKPIEAGTLDEWRFQRNKTIPSHT